MHLYTPRLSQVKKQPSTSRIHAWQLHIPPQDQSAWDSSYIITINWSRLSSLSIGIQCIPSFFFACYHGDAENLVKRADKREEGTGIPHLCSAIVIQKGVELWQNNQLGKKKWRRRYSTAAAAHPVTWRTDKRQHMHCFSLPKVSDITYSLLHWKKEPLLEAITFSALHPI